MHVAIWMQSRIVAPSQRQVSAVMVEGARVQFVKMKFEDASGEPGTSFKMFSEFEEEEDGKMQSLLDFFVPTRASEFG